MDTKEWLRRRIETLSGTDRDIYLEEITVTVMDKIFNIVYDALAEVYDSMLKELINASRR